LVWKVCRTERYALVAGNTNISVIAAKLEAAMTGRRSSATSTSGARSASLGGGEGSGERDRGREGHGDDRRGPAARGIFDEAEDLVMLEAAAID
jgi:hypothetical protein